MSSCAGIPTGRSSCTCTAMRSRRGSGPVRSRKRASRPVRQGGFPSMYIPVRHGRKRCLCISKSIRSKAAVALLVGASLLRTGPAAAHGFGQRYDLPLPLSLYLFGTAAAVILSFVVVGLFARHTPGARSYPRIDLGTYRLGRWLAHPALTGLLKLIAAGLFLLTVTAGFCG